MDARQNATSCVLHSFGARQRSLTGFAVAWGIFMLIFLLGAGNGLINAQLQQSTRFLANSMRVFPGETSKAYKGLEGSAEASRSTTRTSSSATRPTASTWMMWVEDWNRIT